VSNPDSDLLNPFYPIKVSEFLKIHFNPYEGIKKQSDSYFLSIKKKYADY